MRHTDPRELLVNIAKILRKLNMPYMVTGGIAVLVWGRPRFTADIDIIVEIEKSDVPQLERALRLLSKAGYFDKNAILDAIEHGGEFNFIDGDTGIKVDFWAFRKNDMFDKQRFKRRIFKVISGEKIYFTSAEDLILAKLKWHAQSSSVKQLEDAESIVKISNKILDWGYLKKTARFLGVDEFLRRILG